MRIKTNHQYRDILHSHDLTARELADFDYIEDLDSASFFRYKGQVYDLGEFMRIDRTRECLPDGFEHWHGYQSDSFFSGLLVRYSSDYEQILVAQYFN